MRHSSARNPAVDSLPVAGDGLRVAFVGPRVWLDGCYPTAPVQQHTLARFDTDDSQESGRTHAALDAFQPHTTVVLDPPSVSSDLLRGLSGVTLGLLVAGLPAAQAAREIDQLDRLIAFDPSLTGERVGGGEIWRAIPPPVSDLLFGEVQPSHHAPRAMSIGRSSEHREQMLLDAKHHHDLLQLIHGLSGAELRELLAEYQVGVHVARERGGGFGHQAALHLAAGQLLLSEPLSPAHGLERNIDYLQLDSPHSLVWILERLARFPEMHHAIRVRGRLKAEQFRASRVFGRLLHDLLLDVRAFGARPVRAG